MGGLIKSVGNLVGIGGESDDRGAGFQAQTANIVQPSTAAQANQAYNQTQAGLSQQQQFINSLQAQNGIGNQQSVFNQQQQLAQALQNQAMGLGPNPAQDALNAATGTNVANQASLMAGQRGAGANAGLIARQAAQQGAATQQQAAGQSATMQAQQQSAAQQALQNQQQNLAGLANQQVGQQANAITGYNQAAQGQQGQILGGIQGQNNANVSMVSNTNNANSGIAQQNANNTAKAQGGLLNAAGSVASLVGLAHGGEIPSHLYSMSEIYHPGSFKQGGEIPGKAKVKGDSPKNDTVVIKASPGEVMLPRSVTQGPDAPEKARAFVAQLQKKEGYSENEGEEDDFKSALKRAISTRKGKKNAA